MKTYEKIMKLFGLILRKNIESNTSLVYDLDIYRKI